MKIGPKLGLYSIGYQASRRLVLPKLLPINITVSVTFKCNSKCRTCNIWRKYIEEPSLIKKELELEEFEKIFHFLGKTPVWFTLSGGEPFLRSDIVEIFDSICRNNNPRIINIPSNGILTKRIVEKTSKILEITPRDIILIINLSLDGIGEKHDKIRGISGNFKHFMETFEKLKELKMEYKNFRVGIHTVLSIYNQENTQQLYEYVINDLGPDQYITEMAEERVELGTIGSGITPIYENYSKIIDLLSSNIKEDTSLTKDFSGVVQAMRLNYYDIAKKILKESRQVIPCYAGWASGHITPHGDVWACCIKAESVGNLRDVDYNFSKVWFSKKADEIRRSIKAGDCFCPLANASYTNMICNFGASMNILKNLAYLKLRK